MEDAKTAPPKSTGKVTCVLPPGHFTLVGEIIVLWALTEWHMNQALLAALGVDP